MSKPRMDGSTPTVSVWSILGNSATAYVYQAECAVAHGEAAGLTKAEAREVIAAWAAAYAATPWPLSWPKVRAAMLRRATGEGWKP